MAVFAGRAGMITGFIFLWGLSATWPYALDTNLLLEAPGGWEKKSVVARLDCNGVHV